MTSYSPSPFSHFVRKSHPTPSRLYDVFWHFAFARHQVYTRRITGDPYPWTNDPVLSSYKFTNIFRAADRVSQKLIRILYSHPYVDPNTLVLRVLLFKIFNKIDTWDAVARNMGIPAAPNFCGFMVAPFPQFRDQGAIPRRTRQFPVGFFARSVHDECRSPHGTVHSLFD